MNECMVYPRIVLHLVNITNKYRAHQPEGASNTYSTPMYCCDKWNSLRCAPSSSQGFVIVNTTIVPFQKDYYNFQKGA